MPFQLPYEQWRHQGGMGHLPPQSEALPASTCSSSQKKMTKISHFRQIFGILPPSELHFAPLMPPTKKFWCRHCLWETQLNYRHKTYIYFRQWPWTTFVLKNGRKKLKTTRLENITITPVDLGNGCQLIHTCKYRCLWDAIQASSFQYLCFHWRKIIVYTINVHLCSIKSISVSDPELLMC